MLGSASRAKVPRLLGVQIQAMFLEIRHLLLDPRLFRLGMDDEVARAARPLSAIGDERRRRIRPSPPAACDREALQATLDSLLAA